MAGSVKKFRFGNLVINLAPGPGAAAGEKCVKAWSLQFTPDCCLMPSQCHFVFSKCPGFWSRCRFPSDCDAYTMCGGYSPCGLTYCPWMSEIPCGVSLDFDLDKLTPIIKETIPEVTDIEAIAVLKADLLAAMEVVERQEKILTATGKPRTTAEAEELEKKLTEALREVQAAKKELKE